MNEQDSQALEIYQEIMELIRQHDASPEVIEKIEDFIHEQGLSPVPNSDASADICEATEPRLRREKLPCPNCGSVHTVRNGTTGDGRQRYLCRECGASFGDTTGKAQYGARDLRGWDYFLECVVSDDTLSLISQKCGISIATAHARKQRLMAMVGSSRIGTALRGVVQEDEAYYSASFKGNKAAKLNIKRLSDEEKGNLRDKFDQLVPDYEKYGFRDYPHLRGGADKRRGLSVDKVCVATAVDEDKNMIGKAVKRGGIDAEGLGRLLDGRLADDVMLVTDKSKASYSYADSAEINHLGLKSDKEARSGRHNLQLVNAIHSKMGEMMRTRRACATKYTDNYIAWIGWNYLYRDKTVSEKVAMLKRMHVIGQKPLRVKEIKAMELQECLRTGRPARPLVNVELEI